MRERYGVGFWKEIRKEWPLMRGNFIFSMGDGRRVRFWEDRWCGDDTLSRSFPLLFELAASKEEWVVSGEEGGWNPHFSRSFNDWEMEMVERWISKNKKVEASCSPKRVGFDVR